MVTTAASTTRNSSVDRCIEQALVPMLEVAYETQIERIDALLSLTRIKTPRAVANTLLRRPNLSFLTKLTTYMTINHSHGTVHNFAALHLSYSRVDSLLRLAVRRKEHLGKAQMSVGDCRDTSRTTTTVWIQITEFPSFCRRQEAQTKRNTFWGMGIVTDVSSYPPPAPPSLHEMTPR